MPPQPGENWAKIAKVTSVSRGGTTTFGERSKYRSESFPECRPAGPRPASGRQPPAAGLWCIVSSKRGIIFFKVGCRRRSLRLPRHRTFDLGAIVTCRELADFIVDYLDGGLAAEVREARTPPVHGVRTAAGTSPHYETAVSLGRHAFDGENATAEATSARPKSSSRQCFRRGHGQPSRNSNLFAASNAQRPRTNIDCLDQGIRDKEQTWIASSTRPNGSRHQTTAFAAAAEAEYMEMPGLKLTAASA